MGDQLDKVAAQSGAEEPALLNERPMGPLHYRIIGLCFAAWIFDFYDLILYSFLLVPIARDLNLSRADSSLALGLSLGMTALGGVLFGFFGDRFGRKPTIIVSVLVYGIGTILCADSHNLRSLLIYRSFTGLGIGGEWAAGQSLIAESVPAERRGRYLAYVQVGAPMGVLMAAFVGGYLEPAIGWRAVFLVSAAPAFIVAAAVWSGLPESDVWRRGGSEPEFSEGTIKSLWQYRGIVGLLFIVLLVNSEAYWFTYSWMPGYFQLTRHLSAQASSRLMMGMQIGALAGYGAFGLLADRFGRRPVFSAYAAMMALGILPATLFWDAASGVHGLIAAGLVVAGIGTGIWAGAGAIISELLPTRIRNSALGLLLNVTRGIQFFTPIAITILSTRLGLGATLAIGAGFSALGSGMVWLLPETRGREITLMDEAGPALS
ncbi:MAG TPA: MFS transporter [Candidatus Binataceae bacterium]|nr:MFS transporter [Candidatus Binataceae bacterium]